MKRMFRFFAAFMFASILMLCGTFAASAVYEDVPNNALGEEVRKAAEYGLMNGFSDSVFGYSAPMTRAQFITVLDRMLLSAENGSPLTEAMQVSETLSDVHRVALSRAVTCNVVDNSAPFRAQDFVTREEMSEMLVKALGLNDVALALSSGSTHMGQYAAPFQDLPKGKEGYATIAYAIGMTNGASKTEFNPDGVATRAQVASMLVRVYEKLHQYTDFHHGFISSDAQMNSAKQMDIVSLEWSRMTWSAANVLLTTTDTYQGHFIPSNYENIVEELTKIGVKLYLSVYMETSDGLQELLADKDGVKRAVEQILHELTVLYPALGKNPYSGVTIDFEGLHKEQCESFTNFLVELKGALLPAGKGLYVCVAPYIFDSRREDGYDYRAIADIADKIILRAYGYEAGNLNNFLGTKAYQNEAPAPADNVCLSLLDLTAAVPDTAKLLLEFRFLYTAWEVDSANKLISGVPVPISFETLEQRLKTPDTETGWAFSEQMPYAIYNTPQGSRYFIWHENEKSVRKKAEIARLLGVTGLSYKPLSQIPYD